MRRTVPLLLCALLWVSCATGIVMRQHIMRDEKESIDALSPADAQALNSNWQIAESLAMQDKMAWTGTDSVLPSLDEKEKKELQGYVVSGSPAQGDVFFYSIGSDSVVKAVAVATFRNNRFLAVTKQHEINDSNIIRSAICTQRAKTLNGDYIRELRVRYNTYSLVSGTGYTVYLAPGSINNYFIFCGGIKTVFDRNMKPVSNIELHKSILIVRMTDIGDVLVRTSSITDVINEIDILQYLVWKKIVYNQTIVTKKYIFNLYHIPDENRIIKQVSINEKGKKLKNIDLKKEKK